MGFIDDDGIVQGFIEESNEHLQGIEADLLAIEEQGADIDDDLVNKVFRAIHSIKGGAGFLGLEKIKDLSHDMENVLNLIRNHELVPDADAISTLLAGADLLRELVNSRNAAGDADITPLVESLRQVTTGTLSRSDPDSLAQVIDITIDDRTLFSLPRFEMDQALKGGRVAYVARYDYKADIEARDLTTMDIIKEIQSVGIYLSGQVHIDIEDDSPDEHLEAGHFPFVVLFTTVLEPDMITSLVPVDEARIWVRGEDGVFRVLIEHLSRDIPESGDDAGDDDPGPAELLAEPDTAEPAPSPPVPAPLPADGTDKGSAAPPAPGNARPAPTANGASPSSPASSSATLRVNVRLLDTLMTLAGELVLTRNQLVQSLESTNPTDMKDAIQRVDLLTSDLQEAIMSTRLQPIGIVFNKFQRVVRDMGRTLNKDVELEIEGQEVELDKAIIETIGDPLTHLVRNAMDHGIEDAAARRAAGKEPRARLKLLAVHEAGQVVIEVSDDGGGIDPEAVKARALDKGIITPDQAADMGANELVQLIFRPGFSTATTVTEISGRGVGLDVVRNNLSHLGGAIDIDSRVGRGTTFRIKLPLTLAIIPCLIVESRGARYAIPQVNVGELVRIPPEQVATRIERIDNAEVIRRRGELLPLVHLRAVLGDEGGTGGAAAEQGPRNIVVVNAGDMHYGLIVDRLLDSEEIVVKPLGRHLRQIPTYAGATILGDGRAALILDVTGIRKATSLKAVGREGATGGSGDRHLPETARDTQSLLLVRNAAEEQFAIPLGLVSRIEKIHRRDIRTTGGRSAMKYRGGNLVLLAIEEAVPQARPRADVDHPHVIIFPYAGREVGLVVSQIVDVLEASIAIDEQTFRQPGVAGSAILLDEITLMLDVFAIIGALLPTWAEASAGRVAAAQETGSPTVLIVDDSAFLRSQIEGIVSDGGYATRTAADGLEGLEVLRQEGEAIDLVLTDIEMPRMDGVGMTRAIRTDLGLTGIPILALTSLAGERAEQTALEAGVDEYLIKLDREKILDRLGHYLGAGAAASAALVSMDG